MVVWKLYTGVGTSHDQIRSLVPEDRPPWRPCHTGNSARNPWLGRADHEQPEWHRGRTYKPTDEEIDAINTAIHLRRPLLVEGQPGVGKSSLASSIAYELRLGPVLQWSITTRTTLSDGLYRYDAIARLQDAARQSEALRMVPSSGAARTPQGTDVVPYLRLGPLGTALLPWDYPRVLLIDEFDKGDVDLPNDLLHVLEQGRFTVPELARLGIGTSVYVPTDDNAPASGWPLVGGRVACRAFPIILITSNGERVFPPAFLRRCIRLRIEQPEEDRLREIVLAHFAEHAQVAEYIDDLVTLFAEVRAEEGQLATDQLLNAVFLRLHGLLPPHEEKAAMNTWLRDHVFQSLGEALP